MVKRHPTVGILVGDDGRVYSLDGNERCQQDYGYMRVMVKKKTYAVHRLVAETFIQIQTTSQLLIILIRIDEIIV